jgi:hypothetical protein
VEPLITKKEPKPRNQKAMEQHTKILLLMMTITESTKPCGPSTTVRTTAVLSTQDYLHDSVQ